MSDTMNVNEIVGNAIRLYREECGVTQQELADGIGVSRPTVVAMEQGQINISIERLYAVSNCLNVPVALFLPDATAQMELHKIRSEYEQQVKAWREKHGLKEQS